MTGRTKILTSGDCSMSDQAMAAGFATAFLDYAVAEGVPRGRLLTASGLPSDAGPGQAHRLIGTRLKIDTVGQAVEPCGHAEPNRG